MTNRTEDMPLRTQPRGGPRPATPRSSGQWSIRTASLTAGAALLLMSVVAIFGNVIVVDGMITEGDAARTATDIDASQGLFRLGIGSLILVVVLDVVVAWALYRVFSPVSASLSMLAAALRLVYSGVFMVAIAQLVGVARLLSDDDMRAALGAEHVDAQAMLGVAAFNDIWYVGQALFGAHLLLIGYLAHRSGYIPRVLGALLVLAGAGYAIDSLGAVLSHSTWTDVSSYTFMGEFLLALWLVLRASRIATSASALEAGPSGSAMAAGITS